MSFDIKRFNPTLVRLRLITLLLIVTASLSFNPTLVRLRPWRPYGPVLRSVKFQSHAGSIEADPNDLRQRAP